MCIQCCCPARLSEPQPGSTRREDDTVKAAPIQAGRHAWRSAGIAPLVSTLGVVGAGTAAGQERAGAVRAIAALVDAPHRCCLWILSREPQHDQAA